MTIHTNMTEPAPVRFQAGQNRITEIKKTNDTVTVAVYTYDALSRRIQVKDARAADAKYKRFYYDGQRVLLETTLNDTPTAGSEADDRYYVYGNYIDEPLLMTDNLGATAADHYYGHDHLFQHDCPLRRQRRHRRTLVSFRASASCWIS